MAIKLDSVWLASNASPAHYGPAGVLTGGDILEGAKIPRLEYDDANDLVVLDYGQGEEWLPTTSILKMKPAKPGVAAKGKKKGSLPEL